MWLTTSELIENFSVKWFHQLTLLFPEDVDVGSVWLQNRGRLFRFVSASEKKNKPTLTFVVSTENKWSDRRKGPKRLFPAALEHIGRCVMHPFSPFSPLTSIENMPKTLCFVLDRSSELLFLSLPVLYFLLRTVRVTDEHCLKYKCFQCRVFLCVASFYRSEPMGQQRSDWPDDARSVCLASLPAGPVRFSFHLLLIVLNSPHSRGSLLPVDAQTRTNAFNNSEKMPLSRGRGSLLTRGGFILFRIISGSPVCPEILNTSSVLDEPHLNGTEHKYSRASMASMAANKLEKNNKRRAIRHQNHPEQEVSPKKSPN